MSKDAKINPQDLAKEILQINKEIESLVKQGEERLAKGMPLRKDGDELPPPPGAPEGAPAPAPAPDAGMEGPEGQEQEGPEGQEGQEPGPGQEGQEPGPGQEGQDDRAAVEAQVKEMSDDEINTALEVLMAEKEARESAQGEQAAAPAPGAPAPGGAPEMAQKSMDSAMDKMAKSMEAMTKTVEKLTGQVATLSKPAPAPKPSVATKPAAMNAVEVLHKSGKPAEQRLSKAGTMDFVLSEQKLRKSRHVLNTDLVSRLNRVQTDHELHELQDYMTAKGIVLPKL